MVELVRRNAAAWQFEPELRDGVAVPFRTQMQLRPVQMRVPVTFSMDTTVIPVGRWRPYLPGPR